MFSPLLQTYLIIGLMFVSLKINDLETIFLKMMACIAYRHEYTKNIFIINKDA